MSPEETIAELRRLLAVREDTIEKLLEERNKLQRCLDERGFADEEDPWDRWAHPYRRQAAKRKRRPKRPPGVGDA